MPIALTGTSNTPPTQASAGPSVSQPNSTMVQVAGLTHGQVTGPLCVYYGHVATGNPATFADLVGATRDPGSINDGQDAVSITLIGSTYVLSLRQSGTPMTAGHSAGERTFAALFFVDPPISSTPVQAFKQLANTVA